MAEERTMVCDRCKARAKVDLGVPLNTGWRNYQELHTKDMGYIILLCEKCYHEFLLWGKGKAKYCKPRVIEDIPF